MTAECPRIPSLRRARSSCFAALSRARPMGWSSGGQVRESCCPTAPHNRCWTSNPAVLPNSQICSSADITGRIETEQQSRDLGWQSVMHPDDLPKSAKRWLHSLSTGEPYESEHRMLSGGGDYRWFLARGVRLRNFKSSSRSATHYCSANSTLAPTLRLPPLPSRPPTKRCSTSSMPHGTTSRPPCAPWASIPGC